MLLSRPVPPSVFSISRLCTEPTPRYLKLISFQVSQGNVGLGRDNAR